MADQAGMPIADQDGIDRGLDEIQNLHTLRGEEYVIEAKRLGLLVSERGTRLDLDNPINDQAVDLETAEETIRRLFARHGVDWTPEDQATVSH